ncbi:unnamed protein product, partial [Discosporangium mesarthrocarpum]
MAVEACALTMIDVIGLLLLLRQPHHANAIHSILNSLSAHPERLPRSLLRRLASRTGDPQWGSLAEPLLELGLWAVISPPPPPPASGLGGGGGGGTWLSDVVPVASTAYAGSPAPAALPASPVTPGAMSRGE